MKRTERLGLAARLLLALSAVLSLAPAASAAGGGDHPYFQVDTGNLAGLQRGARNFMAYCSGCHGMKYLRYNRIGQDLGIPEKMLADNLMFTSDKPGDVILAAMPPDLSLTARSRGAEWISHYLQSFYLDPTRPLGVNNTVLAGASMPHVLGELQGWQKAVYVDEPVLENGQPKLDSKTGQPVTQKQFKEFQLVQPGSMSAEEYRKFVADITNFMVYAGEPGRNERISRGWGVLAFLLVFLGFAYALKKEYWKDVH